MKLTVRLISLLLAAVIAGSLSACGNNADDDAAQNTQDTVSGSAETSGDTGELTLAQQRASISDGLPDTKFDGKEFTALIREETAHSFYCEEQEGENFRDMLYYRDVNVSERFDVKLNYKFIAGGWNDMGTYLTHVRNSHASGDRSFMLGDGYAAYITSIAGENLAYNLNDLTYLNTEAPWWFEKCVDELNINNKCFFIAGDLSVYTWQAIFCLVFNKQLVEDYGFGDLYSIVKEGNWTLDKLEELSKSVYTDVNYDGIKNWEDIFGLIIPISSNVDAMQLMLDTPITIKDSEGFPEFNLDNERFVNMTERVYTFLYENQGIFCAPEEAGVGEAMNSSFQSNKTVICASNFGAMQSLRSMEIDFGIIPYPKYDENQENYYSVAADAYTLYFMLSNIGDDADFASIITEALCAESYRIVIPEYYEITLKSKGTRDNESEEMIDLIRDSLTFNFGAINSVGLAGGAGYGPAQVLRVTIRSGSTKFVSNWEANRRGSTRKLEELLEAYR